VADTVPANASAAPADAPEAAFPPRRAGQDRTAVKARRGADAVRQRPGQRPNLQSPLTQLQAGGGLARGDHRGLIRPVHPAVTQRKPLQGGFPGVFRRFRGLLADTQRIFVACCYLFRWFRIGFAISRHEQATVPGTRQRQAGGLDLHGLQIDLSGQRLQVGQAHGDPTHLQQRPSAGVHQRHTTGRDLPGDPHDRLVDLLEVHPQVGIHHRPGEADRQIGRQIRQVRCQIQTGEPEGRVGPLGAREWCGLGPGIENHPVEAQGQQGLGVDLPVSVQIAEERHGNLQRVDPVDLADRLIVKHDGAAAQAQVVQRESRGLGGGGLRRAPQAVEHVVQVIAPVPLTFQPHGRRFDGDRLHHGRQAKQRLQLGIDVNPRHLQLRLASRRCGDRQVTNFQLQRPGPEIDLSHADLATQRFTGVLLGLVTQHRRQHQPAQRPHQEPASRQPTQPPRPPR
jgi:hypothetical protein